MSRAAENLVDTLLAQIEQDGGSNRDSLVAAADRWLGENKVDQDWTWMLDAVDLIHAADAAIDRSKLSPEAVAAVVALCDYAEEFDDAFIQKAKDHYAKEENLP